jgi:transposase
MRAFYQRVRSRRGHQIAIVAAARKLASLFWFLLTREEDYAYQQPSLTKKKLRRLEIAAGAPKYQGRSNIWSTNDAMRDAERALAEQAEHAYKNTVRDWQATQAKTTAAKEPLEVGASATTGRASNKPSKGKAARQTTSP